MGTSSIGRRRGGTPGIRPRSAALALLALLAAACGPGGSRTEPPQAQAATTSTAADATSTSVSRVPATAVPVRVEVTGSGPAAPASRACPLGASLVAADAVTGTVAWSHCAATIGGIEALAAIDGIVLALEYEIGEGGARLVGLDETTGAVRWAMALPAMGEWGEKRTFSAEGDRAGGGTVVFSAMGPTDTVIVGVDVRTGALRWQRDLPIVDVAAHDPDVAVLSGSTSRYWAPGTPKPGTVLMALDRRSGAIRWRRDDLINLWAPWAPRAGGGLFVFPQIEDLAAGRSPQRWDSVAVDLGTGDERWRRSGGPLLITSVDDTTGVGSYPSDDQRRWVLEVFDPADGAARWSVRLPAGDPLVRAEAGSPVVAVGVRHVEDSLHDPRTATTVAPGAVPDGSPGTVAVYDRADGRLRFGLAGGVRPVLVTADSVVVARVDELVAVSSDDGAVRWRLPVPVPYEPVVRHLGDRVYMGGLAAPSVDDMPAYAVDLDSGTELARFPVEGREIRLVETPDLGTTRYVCVGVGTATTAVGCMPERRPAGSPIGKVSSTLPVHLDEAGFHLAVVLLPAGHPRPVRVLDRTGSPWPAAEGTAADLLFVLLPGYDGDPGGGLVLDVVAPDGTVLIRLGDTRDGWEQAPTESGSAVWVPLAQCYRSNGVAYTGDPNPMAVTTPTSALPSAVAVRAWETCRSSYPDLTGRILQSDEYRRCMVEAGWLPPFNDGAQADQWSPAARACGG
jgi:outer membrane protein assembly factor BamB